MKASFIYTIWWKNIGAILLICIAGLLGMGRSSFQTEATTTKKINLQNKFNNNEAATNHIVKLYVTSNEFRSTDQHGNNESLHLTFCSPLYAYKLIRSSLFDTEQSSILSQRLAWYIRSTYILRLSPFWQPSIPIAHRKLVI